MRLSILHENYVDPTDPFSYSIGTVRNDSDPYPLGKPTRWDYSETDIIAYCKKVERWSTSAHIYVKQEIKDDYDDIPSIDIDSNVNEFSATPTVRTFLTVGVNPMYFTEIRGPNGQGISSMPRNTLRLPKELRGNVETDSIEKALEISKEILAKLNAVNLV